MLKTTKRYVINSNAVNNYGYRVLSEGIDQSQYKNNPVMLWLHHRPAGATKNEVLALGYVKEIEVDRSGIMTGQPYFDDSDDFAKSLYSKYQNGTYNMFSLCALPLEISNEPKDLLPGQTGPTITKSLLKEISAVDIGGNPDAYGVELCDEDGKLIKLSDVSAKPVLNSFMDASAKLKAKLIALSWDELWRSGDLAKLKDISPEDYNAKFKQHFNKEPIMDNEKTTNSSVVKLSESQQIDAEVAGWIEIENILNFAIEVGKIDPADKSFYLSAAVKDGKAAKVKMIALSAPIKPDLLKGRYRPVIIKLACMTWNEIERAPGGALELQRLAPELYKAKFYEKHGRMPAC